MSEEYRFQGREVAGPAYPLGLRRTALIRLLLLFAASIFFLALHYVFLWKLTNWLLALLLLVGTWVAILLRLHRYVPGWINFFLKDSAYGVINEDGIEYHSVLRSRFVPWSSVARIEYSPRNGHRIDVFKAGAFTFSRVQPIRFGSAPYNGNTVHEIEKILERQGDPEKLVTRDSVPEKFFHL